MTDARTGLKNSQLPQFNGKNHSYWSITMKTLFASQGIWELVETGYAEPTDATALVVLTVAKRDQLKSDMKKDAKALFFLFQSVSESVFPRIAAATKSKEAWDIHKTVYQGMEKVKTSKLQMLRRDFETLSMKESDTIDSFFTQGIGLITQIRSHGEILEERIVVEKILRCLPSRFEAVVVAIEETKDLSQFMVDELRKKQNDMNSRQNVNFANEVDNNPKNVLLTCNIAQDKQKDFWFLDSGCSNHMTENIAMFANLDENVKSKVTTGTDSKISVKGKGRVSIRAKNGEDMIVPEVYYVPGLKCNLLSIG
eukprot:PITA_23651